MRSDRAYRPTAWAAILALLLATAGSAQAGLVVVSGDENITNALVGSSTPVNAGNQTFFANVLGSGQQILVQGSDPGGVDTPVANINTFYNTLAGVTSTVQVGPVTAASLAGKDLFVSAIPAAAFTPAEISAIASFATAGGSVFLLGDAAAFAGVRNQNLNDLLIGIGSGLRIVPDDLDSGFRTVGGSQIASTPLTAGVTSFTYAFVSQVSGGTPQFFTSGGQTFIASEGSITSVPEPVTAVSAGIGVLGVLAFRWRRRGKAA